jgi:multicomponent Na+:H+ antiporter subunit E
VRISLRADGLNLDVATDRRVLFIHAMYAPDADRVRGEIKEGLERRLLEITRNTVSMPRPPA